MFPTACARRAASACNDPMVFVAVAVLLSGVALVGVRLPARRAARVDPATALRAE